MFENQAPMSRMVRSLAHRALFLMPLVIALMGCNRGCDPSPTQIPEACALPKACNEGQILVCGNTCITPVPEGLDCIQDNPCAENGVCANHGVCQQRTIGEGSTCAAGPTADQVFDNCQYIDGGKNPCTGGLACVKAARCPAQLPSDFDSSSSFCVLPVEEGSPCDSTLTHVAGGSQFDTARDCLPCKAGLVCESLDDGDRRCVRPCESDRDCPCFDASGSPTAEACHHGVCHTCRNLREPCDELAQCCGEGLACGAIVGSDVNQCCRQRHASCESDTDCCQEPNLDGPEICVFVPGQGHRCQTCAPEGEDCNDGSQCCEGLTCGYDETCQRPCEASAACTVPGFPAGTVCAVGVEICPDVFGAPLCVTNPWGLELEAEPGNACDGRDNDCDGLVDEEYVPRACVRNPNECSDAFEVPSTTVCVDAVEECQPVALGEDYCTQASAGNTTCGALLGTICSEELPCEPNAECVETATGGGICGVHTDGVNCPQPLLSCWLPSQVGISSGVRGRRMGPSRVVAQDSSVYREHGAACSPTLSQR